MIFKLLVLVTAIFISNSQSVADWPFGVSIGSDTPTLHIEGFFDLLGSTSSESYYVLRQVLQNFNINSNPGLRFTAYVWPQPSITFSYAASVGARFIANRTTADLWTYYELMFNNYQSFNNSVTYNSSLSQVQAQIATLVNKAMPQYSYDDILAGLTASDYMDQASYLAAWGRFRGIVTAPSYIGNGVLIDAGGELTVAYWTTLIQQFVSATSSPCEVSGLTADAFSDILQ
jgi:hypothetical protein